MLLGVLLEERRQAGDAKRLVVVFFSLTGVAFITWTGGPHGQSLTASLDNHLLDAQSQTFLLQQRQHSEGIRVMSHPSGGVNNLVLSSHFSPKKDKLMVECLWQ